jgi:hypothetical protein
MSKHPRPSVVTLAGVFIAITAFLGLTELITALTNWGSVEMKDALQPAIRQLDAAGVQVTMTGLLRILRWIGLGLILYLVSALVFAVYALRGDARSRTATSILAVGAGLMSLPLGAFGFLQAAMMFLAAAAFWSPDARRWYRGEAPLPKPEQAQPLAPAEAGTPPPPSIPSASRPTSVLTAGLVAIVGSFLAASLAAIFLLVHTFGREAYVDAIRSGPFGDRFTTAEVELAIQVLYWVSVAIIPLAIVGLLGGVALLARLRFGRTTLIVWGWAMALVGLLLLPLGLLATAGAIAVIVLLRRDDVRAWIAG